LAWLGLVSSAVFEHAAGEEIWGGGNFDTFLPLRSAPRWPRPPRWRRPARPVFGVREHCSRTPVRSCALCSFAALADPGPCSRTGCSRTRSFVFRSATPARLVYVDRWVLVLLLLEGGVHRSICASWAFFFGAVHGFTSLTDRVLELRLHFLEHLADQEQHDGALTLRVMRSRTGCSRTYYMFVFVRLSAVCPWRPCSRTGCSRTLFVRLRFVCIFRECLTLRPATSSTPAREKGSTLVGATE